MAYTLLRSQSRPNPIFPNLCDISWSLTAATPESSNESVHILVFHPGVRNLTLYNIAETHINSDVYPLRALFQDVAKLAPNLAQLEIVDKTVRNQLLLDFAYSWRQASGASNSVSPTMRLCVPYTQLDYTTLEDLQGMLGHDNVICKGPMDDDEDEW